MFLLPLVAAVAGCSNGSWSLSNPWKFDRPPVTTAARSTSDHAYALVSERTIVAVGQFQSPARSPVAWRDIGPGMSDALASALLNHNNFDVWIDAGISRQVAEILRRSPTQRAKGFAQVQSDYPEVHFVITGKVTDFHHTSELPREVSRWGIFKRRNEAVVAINFNVVDLQRQRIVATDHVYGTAGVSKTPSKQLYQDLEFGSYLFWSTPLGKASRQAIERTIERVIEVLPSQMGEPRILNLIAARKVSINGGWSWGLVEGRRYYVCTQDDDAGLALRPVLDPDTRQPLQVRISRVNKETSTAWLLGKKPPGDDLRGAQLLRYLPQPPPDSSAEARTIAERTRSVDTTLADRQ